MGSTNFSPHPLRARTLCHTALVFISTRLSHLGFPPFSLGLSAGCLFHFSLGRYNGTGIVGACGAPIGSCLVVTRALFSTALTFNPILSGCIRLHFPFYAPSSSPLPTPPLLPATPFFPPYRLHNQPTHSTGANRIFPWESHTASSHAPLSVFSPFFGPKATPSSSSNFLFFVSISLIPLSVVVFCIDHIVCVFSCRTFCPRCSVLH